MKDYNLFGKLENHLLTSIGSLDLEFLYLGYQNGGNFNEKDIENSELNRLGVGRVLDTIASLKERRLITQNQDNTFSITNGAKQILWNDEIPLWVKILRILEIRAFPLTLISKYLTRDKEEVSNEIETMRKNELVLMSPQRTDKGLEKIFEIMPRGLDELEKINSKGFDNSDLILEKKPKESEVFDLLDEIKKILENESEMESKDLIIEKLELIKSKLKI